MSEDEQDQICGQIIREYGEAKRRLACVEEKERQLVETVQNVLGTLKEDQKRDIGKTSYVQCRDGKLEVQGHPIDWPTQDALCTILNKKQHAKEEIRRLSAALRNLGHPYTDYIRL
ncbi:MAG: hypothetical protein OXB94_05875 [Nitrospira sp.]|nr:hypothetical protein [Nitrospira sp.]